MGSSSSLRPSDFGQQLMQTATTETATTPAPSQLTLEVRATGLPELLFGKHAHPWVLSAPRHTAPMYRASLSSSSAHSQDECMDSRENRRDFSGIHVANIRADRPRVARELRICEGPFSLPHTSSCVCVTVHVCNRVCERQCVCEREKEKESICMETYIYISMKLFKHGKQTQEGKEDRVAFQSQRYLYGLGLSWKTLKD